MADPGGALFAGRARLVGGTGVTGVSTSNPGKTAVTRCGPSPSFACGEMMSPTFGLEAPGGSCAWDREASAGAARRPCR
jgi:hypothetical protein